MSHYRSLVLGALGASSAAWLVVGCSSVDEMGSLTGRGGSNTALAGAMNVAGTTTIGNGGNGNGGTGTAGGSSGTANGGASGAAQGGLGNGGASGAAQGGLGNGGASGAAQGGLGNGEGGGVSVGGAGTSNGGGAGTADGGAANGGAANGGAANGGNANGGSAGTANGGSGGTSTGGSASGGSTGCVPNYQCKPVAPNTGDAEADCVARVNQFRACVCLPPLAADPAGDACSDQEAKYDADHNSAHAGIGAKICTPAFFAENECPGWPSKQSTIDGCSQQMFNEGPPPTPKCTGACYSAHGHFINMTGKYKSVSCGFFTTADGKVWTVQNFR